MVTETDIHAICTALQRVGQRVVLPGFANLSGLGIRTKSDEADLVTDADVAAEEALERSFSEIFPGSLFVGEEMVAADPSLLQRLVHAELAVIIDPIDGTWNFANGIPLFGMMMALVHHGETIAGVIHYPLAGDFIYARKGGGAFHQAADGRQTSLQVCPTKPTAEMSGLVAVPMFPRSEQPAIAQRCSQFVRTTNFRCSAYEYRLIAQGSMHFSLNAGLKPWDHAAGTLVHAEAGGYARLLDGRTYSPSIFEGQLLLAPNQLSWTEVCNIFC